MAPRYLPNNNKFYHDRYRKGLDNFNMQSKKNNFSMGAFC